MVLKDNNGYVKLYALVNVEHPSIVATATSQSEAMKAYKGLLRENGIIDNTQIPDNTLPTSQFIIEDIKTYTIDGNTVFYFVDADGYYYKGLLRDFEDMIFYAVGDQIEIRYSETENAKIREIEKITEIVVPVE
jgi:hypothetical protein